MREICSLALEKEKQGLGEEQQTLWDDHSGTFLTVQPDQPD